MNTALLAFCTAVRRGVYAHPLDGSAGWIGAVLLPIDHRSHRITARIIPFCDTVNTMPDWVFGHPPPSLRTPRISGSFFYPITTKLNTHPLVVCMNMLQTFLEW
jgi:hypothetical protein